MLIICSLFVGAAICGLGSDLGVRLRAAAPQSTPQLGNFMHQLKSFSFVDTISIQRDQVAQYEGIKKTFNLETGLAGRLLRKRKLTHAQAIAAVQAAVNTVFRMHQKITFSPFQDLANLKFGTSYHKIHIEKSIKSPGVSHLKAMATIASRTGSQINYKVGYGWIVGNGVQLYSTTTVRKCRKIFWVKKCKNVQVSIPRGLHPNEFQLVVGGLENRLFNEIAAKVGNGRRLAITEVQDASMGTATTYQSVKGVQKADLEEALQTLTGTSPIAVDMKELESAGSTTIHTTSASQKFQIDIQGQQEFDLNIWTHDISA
jgi:hypothetical protein